MNNYTNDIINIQNTKVKKCNIKKDSPYADVAVYDLMQEIYVAEHTGYEILKVITGYGSHGRGGEIKKLVDLYLLEAKKKKEIKDYFWGEKWTTTNSKINEIIENIPELMIDEDIKNINSGIVIIVLNSYNKEK